MYKRIETHGVSIFLISLLLIRILIMGASIGDAIAFLGLAGFTAYSLYSSRRHDDDVIKQLELYSNAVDSLKQEMSAQKQHLEDIEGGVRNVEFDGTFWAKVPKCHHQAIPVTKQLNVHAVTTQKSTGLSFVEAFSLDNGRVIGVQGHPEWCSSPSDNFPTWIRNKFASYLSS